MTHAWTRQQIREAMLDELADVIADDRAELDAAIAVVGGDNMFELESKQAEAVLAGLSVALGVELPGPADLEPNQFATIDALIDLVEHHLAGTESAA